MWDEKFDRVFVVDIIAINYRDLQNPNSNINGHQVMATRIGTLFYLTLRGRLSFPGPDKIRLT